MACSGSQGAYDLGAKNATIVLNDAWGPNTSFGVLYTLLSTPCVTALSPTDQATISADIISYFQTAMQIASVATALSQIYSAVSSGAGCFNNPGIPSHYLFTTSSEATNFSTWVQNPSTITSLTEITDFYNLLKTLSTYGSS